MGEEEGGFNIFLNFVLLFIRSCIIIIIIFKSRVVAVSPSPRLKKFGVKLFFKFQLVV